MGVRGRRPRLLLGDDERAITDQLAPLLERSGFEVRVVHDAAAAPVVVEVADSGIGIPADEIPYARPSWCAAGRRPRPSTAAGSGFSLARVIVARNF